MIGKKEEFELACNAFHLMTDAEKGIVLTLFKHSKESTIEAWIQSIYKVVKSAQVEPRTAAGSLN